LLALNGSEVAAEAWSIWSLEPAPGYLGALVTARQEGQESQIVIRTEPSGY
jgi:hypothetical protein